MPDNQIKEKSFIYKLLIEPKNRIWRYLLLFMVFGIVAFQQVYVSYGYINGGLFYVTAFAIFALYTFAAFININILTPYFLLKKRYLAYLITLTSVILLFIIIQTGIDYYLIGISALPNNQNVFFSIARLLDNISMFFLMSICILGTSTPFILKQWMLENERIGELEKIRVESQVQQFKDMVDPIFLSNVLKKAAALMLIQREKASAMLYKLSQVLRYQLYDSVRERVLFSAEFKFVSQYLVLQNLCNDEVEFSLEMHGDNNRLTIAPLIFVPIISEVLKFRNPAESENIKIGFITGDDNLTFTCATQQTDISNIDYSKIEQRLGLIYTGKYILSTTSHLIILKIGTV